MAMARLDIVASNWGQNSKYEDSYGADRPLRIYYGDFNEMGRVEIAEAHQDWMTRKWVPERDLTASAAAVPYIRGRTPTFEQFGEADLAQIYGDKLTNAAFVEAREFRHMLFLNRGGKFEAVPLPPKPSSRPRLGLRWPTLTGTETTTCFWPRIFSRPSRRLCATTPAAACCCSVMAKVACVR